MRPRVEHKACSSNRTDEAREYEFYPERGRRLNRLALRVIAEGQEPEEALLKRVLFLCSRTGICMSNGASILNGISE